MTATFVHRRTARAFGCALIALLCLLTTALFALSEASASSAEAPARAQPRAETVIKPARSGDGSTMIVADRPVADSDNPFEHGRLPLASGDVPAPHPVLAKAVVTADAGPVGAESPLPERPPRA